MSRSLLFIQGAGDGAHAEDQALVEDLRAGLGADYRVSYPVFAGLEQLDHGVWRTQMQAELAALDENGIIVAHSLGAAATLKFLLEEAPQRRLRGLFMVATPYKGVDGEWGTDEFAIALPDTVALPGVGALHLYHSADDEWVPFHHLEAWHRRLPQARVRRFDDRGHGFSARPFVELVEDIRAL